MWRLYFIMEAYKIVYGVKNDTHEVFKLKFSDAKALYFQYKKHYMSFKDMESYTEERHFKGIFKDLWSFSAVIKSITYEVWITPIEID